MLVSSPEVRHLSLSTLLCILSKTGPLAGLLAPSHLFSLPRTQMQLAGGTGHRKLDGGWKKKPSLGYTGWVTFSTLEVTSSSMTGGSQ